MTAAAPNPRFRDQLAEALAALEDPFGRAPWPQRPEMSRAGFRQRADALLPLIAAEVEALRKRAEEAEAERDHWKTEAIELISQLNPTPTGDTP